MSKSVKLKLSGFRELERALAEELPKATAKNVLKRTALAAMKPIEDGAKARAPVHTEGHSGSVHLKDYIETQPVKATRISRTRYAKSSGVSVNTGPAAPDRYNRRIAGWQEFGTVNAPAQPYMRPTASAEAQTVINNVRQDLTDRISAAKARIAKKAAKAKG